MILPIVAYGDPVLRKEGEVIDKDYPGFEQLLADMFETMYGASGVGLAAPQVGKAIKLFIVDASPFAKKDEDEDDEADDENDEEGELDDYDESLKDFKKVFINAEILEESGEPWDFNEGCLSIPKVREDVSRLPKIKIKYQDEKFVSHTETFEGIAARIIQHEYDHIMGKLFVDHLTPMRRKMLKGKLDDISKGLVDVTYKMKFPNRRK